MGLLFFANIIFFFEKTKLLYEKDKDYIKYLIFEHIW